MKRDEPFAGWPRFDGAAAWAKLTPEQQRRIGAAAIEVVRSQYGAREVAHLLEIGKELLGIDPSTRPFPIPSIIGPICRVCGRCSHDLIQNGINGWHEHDLCAFCGKVVPFPASRPPSGGGA
jgi:hypothetical protein